MSGFTLEGKGVPLLIIPEDRAPKTIITTNHTIDVSARSDRRRLWFVLISTYYVEQEELTGKTPADFHGGRLLDKHIWDEKECLLYDLRLLP